MSHASTPASSSRDDIDVIRDAIAHARHLLPIQGPIGVFVHHNTLHALQHLEFDDAVVEGARLHGAEPYLSEAAFVRALGTGRIQPTDIDAVTAELDDTPVAGLGFGRRTLRRRLLVPGLRAVDVASAPFLLRERHFGSVLRGDLETERRALVLEGSEEREVARALFGIAEREAAAFLGRQPATRTPAHRPSEGIKRLTGIDVDAVIDPVSIRLFGAFLDQGVASWSMPGREHGFLAAATAVLSSSSFVPPPLLSRMKTLLADRPSTAEETLARSLRRLSVPTRDLGDVILAEAMSLPGWFGMIARVEGEPNLLPHVIVPARLSEALALRFLLVECAAQHAFGPAGDLSKWRTAGASTEHGASLLQRRVHLALQWMDAFQLVGTGPSRLERLSVDARRWLLEELHAFDELTRRRTYHRAYERRHARQVLEPLALHRRLDAPMPPPVRPSVQMVFCIDEREESMRRALEELDPTIETLGAPGFFGVAIDFRGIDDGSVAALCPVIVTPQHAVLERPHPEHQATAELRARQRRFLSSARRNLTLASRSLVRGFAVTAGLGALSLVPAGGRLLFPRLTGKLRGRLADAFLAAPRTELTQHRVDDEGAHHHQHGPTTESLTRRTLGFTLDEQADRVAGLLTPMGLTTRFSKLFVLLGHGATSLNNPHDSAYQCGACGGLQGGPNARLFALFANDARVRERLKSRGVFIPDDTWFIGGQHDTTSDAIELGDVELVPASHARDLEALKDVLSRARAENALERTRRFHRMRTLDPEKALFEVETRSEHLAEPRAEYGHSSNAVAVIGRRSLTRGLFLDRRSFLISYDASFDADDAMLGRILAAGGAVCAGISLEYYFSTVDNETWGCGTKLPHNINGLIGVTNGSVGDLRTGLTSQMVEIHEPVRLLLVIESTPERIERAVGTSDVVTELVMKRWVRVASVDPETGLVRELVAPGDWRIVEPGDGALPTVERSVDWFQRHRGHLPVARVLASLRPPATLSTSRTPSSRALEHA